MYYESQLEQKFVPLEKGDSEKISGSCSNEDGAYLACEGKSDFRLS
jgi:hypothetical protein